MFKTKKVFALITALTMASALGAGAAADAAVIAPEDANVISAADAGMAFAAQYNLGDSVEDFDITLSDGTETSLYKLLAEKKAVMLNFWASWCGPCMSEFPHMNEAAAAAPDMAVVALSIEDSDTDESIAAIKADSQLDAIMMGRDAADMYSRFDREGAIPLSVIIDKNGVLCYMELGAQPSAEAFSGLFSVFTAADYDAPVLIGGENVDTSREVDVERPAAADAEKVLGIADERISVTQDAADDTWPFVVGEDGLAASNGDVTGSIAHIGLTVNVQAGEALKYEYRVASEASDLDVLSVHADGTARRAYVDAAQWRTDYVVFDEAGEHSVDFVMARGYDAQSEAGIRGVRIISAEEAAALEAEKPERPAALEDAQGMAVELAAADQGRMAEYVLKQADGAEYAEEAIIAGADKITLRIRIGADINPNLAVLMINGGKPQNVVLADLPTDGEGYLYECNVPEAMDELGAVYVNVCDDATNAINYVSAQVYKDADALDALVKGMMETIKSQGGEDEISWRYADDAE